jgi:uncharacterized protein YggE
MVSKKEMNYCCLYRGHGGRMMLVLLGILLVYVIFWVGTLIRNNIKEYNHIGFADRSERTIVVDADAKVTATPDIAETNIGMIAEGETVEEAQARNTEVMNGLIEGLKALGIDEADIQTANYNIYPRYNYTESEGRVLDGYEVSQSVVVKIRDLDKANAVFALAGQSGANSVSGLEFIIDDREVYRTQARELALTKAAQKAKILANALGVEIVGIVSYDEFENGIAPPRAYALESDAGLGGASPSIESGTLEVFMNVSVTFEIR